MRSLRTILVVFFLTVLLRPPLGTATFTSGFEPDETTFSISAKNQSISFRTFGLFVLPKEKLTITVEKSRSGETFTLLSDAAGWKESSLQAWEWKAASKPGVYPVRIESSSHEAMTLNIFVMTPATKLRRGYLNGYRIGNYPKKPLKNLSIYRPPVGFVEITPANKHLLVSPHFRLSQFLCKQSGQYPKYVVLREPLLVKLEALLQEVNQHGLNCDSFSVMSGYRTPYYNRSIGNVAYSRHQWGDAADIFIDQNPKDDVMDDLNGDGKINKSDCELLTNLINNLHAHSPNQEILGGMGAYKSTKAHGPFVHVDARGTVKTW